MNYSTPDINKPINLTNGLLIKENLEELDYEMLPIADQLGQTNPLFPKLDRNRNEDYQTSKAMKKLLNQTNAFELNVAEFHSNTLHIFHRETESEKLQEHRVRVLLPLNQVNFIKQTKKYTKINLENGKTIKTSIPFEQLQKILTQRGFSNPKENILRNTR